MSCSECNTSQDPESLYAATDSVTQIDDNRDSMDCSLEISSFSSPPRNGPNSDNQTEEPTHVPMIIDETEPIIINQNINKRPRYESYGLSSSLESAIMPSCSTSAVPPYGSSDSNDESFVMKDYCSELLMAVESIQMELMCQQPEDPLHLTNAITTTTYSSSAQNTAEHLHDESKEKREPSKNKKNESKEAQLKAPKPRVNAGTKLADHQLHNSLNYEQYCALYDANETKSNKKSKKRRQPKMRNQFSYQTKRRSSSGHQYDSINMFRSLAMYHRSRLGSAHYLNTPLPNNNEDWIDKLLDKSKECLNKFLKYSEAIIETHLVESIVFTSNK